MPFRYLDEGQNPVSFSYLEPLPPSKGPPTRAAVGAPRPLAQPPEPVSALERTVQTMRQAISRVGQDVAASSVLAAGGITPEQRALDVAERQTLTKGPQGQRFRLPEVTVSAAPVRSIDATADSGFIGAVREVPGAVVARAQRTLGGAQTFLGTAQEAEAYKNYYQAIVLPRAVRESQSQGIALTEHPEVVEYAQRVGVRPDVFARDWPRYANLSPEELVARQKEAKDRLVKGTELKTSGLERAELAGSYLREFRPKDDEWSAASLTFDILTSVPDLLLAAGAGAIAGPAGGLATLFATTAPAAYADATDMGLSGAKRDAYAFLFGMAEVAPETPVFEAILRTERGKRIMRDMLGRWADSAGVRIAGTAALEAVSEQVTEALQMGIETGVLDKSTTLPEALERIARAGAVGAGMGAGVGAVSEVLRREPMVSPEPTPEAPKGAAPSPPPSVPPPSGQAPGEPPLQAAPVPKKEPAPETRPVAEAGPITEDILAGLRAVQDGRATAEQVAQLEARKLVTRNETNVPRLLPAGRRRLADAQKEAPKIVQTQVAGQPVTVNVQPTEAQKEAGNYQKGRIKIAGLDVVIENPKGSVRSGRAPDGTEWSRKMPYDYGYISRTEGNDGDHVDVYIGPNPQSAKAFVVNQTKEDGTFDEHKALLGFNNVEQAKSAYLRNYPKGWKGLGSIVEMTTEEFRDWTKTGDTKKPLKEPALQFARVYKGDEPVEVKRTPIDTPRFREFFSGSKVKDQRGRPKPVYHGSGVDIMEFKREFTGVGNNALGAGFYFTTDIDEARSYQFRRLRDEEKPGGEDDPTVHEVYLSIKKPIDADAIGSLSPAKIRRIIERAPDLDRSLEDFGDVEYEGREAVLREAVKAYAIKNSNILLALNKLENDFFRGDTEAFHVAVRDELGYDGVYSKEKDGDGTREHWVAWFPEQIKSTANLGDWDQRSPNIYFSRAAKRPALRASLAQEAVPSTKWPVGAALAVLPEKERRAYTEAIKQAVDLEAIPPMFGISGKVTMSRGMWLGAANPGLWVEIAEAEGVSAERIKQLALAYAYVLRQDEVVYISKISDAPFDGAVEAGVLSFSGELSASEIAIVDEVFREKFPDGGYTLAGDRLISLNLSKNKDFVNVTSDVFGNIADRLRDKTSQELSGILYADAGSVSIDWSGYEKQGRARDRAKDPLAAAAFPEGVRGRLDDWLVQASRLDREYLGRKAQRELAAPVPVDRLDHGPIAQLEIYGRFGTLINEATVADLKIYDLSPLVSDPSIVDRFVKDFGVSVDYFNFNPKKRKLPRFFRHNYATGTIWIYDPAEAAGSFKDEQYTRAWRIFHETAHGIGEPLVEAKYGPSKRYGRMGREMIGERGEKRVVSVTLPPLTLKEAQRAVEWEDVAFRIQRKLLERYGVRVTDQDFAREYNINISDAVYRVLTGQFGDPGDYGFMPRRSPQDLGGILKLLEETERGLAEVQGREPTDGIDLSTWKPVSDAELDAVIEEALRAKAMQPSRGEPANILSSMPERSALKEEKKREEEKQSSILFSRRHTIDRDKNFKAWFGDSKVVDPETGKPLIVYHGTRRPDRVGTQFRKSRATSGPMAFFTDSQRIASYYAFDKADTSLKEDRPYDTWFMFKTNGERSRNPIGFKWYLMTDEQRKAFVDKVTKLALFDPEKSGDKPRIAEDDGGEATSIPLEVFEKSMKANRGNGILAAVDVWLTSGMLHGVEEVFMDVLRLAGVPMEGVVYSSPKSEEAPAVIPVYLSIQNPFETDTMVTKEFIDELEAVSKRVRFRYQRGADPWDKRSQSPMDFINVLRTDFERNTTHAWTSIPDWVTEHLKKKGYDGIKDRGGKFFGGGQPHTVWVPFEPYQVKAAYGNVGTFAPDSLNILKSTGQPFFSKLIRELEKVNQERASGEHWAGIIDNLTTKGVKKEEIDWLNISAHLEPDQTYSKQFVVGLARQNQVVVKESLPEPKYQFRGLVYPGGKNYRELVLSWRKESGTSFVSTHFPGIKNPLVHVRFDERVDDDGKRTLLIHEIQSDWHEKGRQIGYFSKEDAKEVESLLALAMDEKTDPDLIDANRKRMQELFKKPHLAPFRASWPALAMKRMIRWAAENGFDRVAWSDGSVQSERYDPFKIVDEIDWHSPKQIGYKVLTIKTKRGDSLVFYLQKDIIADAIPRLRDAIGRSVEELVGQEAAERILSQESGSIDKQELEKIPRGMAAFYDNILVNSTKDLVRKFGSDVVKSDDMDLGPSWKFDVTPEMAAAAMGGLPLFKQDEVGRRTTRRGMPVDRLKFIADRLSRDLENPGIVVVRRVSELPAHYARAVRAAGGDTTVEGFFDGQKIYLIAENIENERAAFDVVMHELVGHYGLRKLMSQAEYEEFMDGLWRDNPRAVREMAERDGRDINDITERRIAAEEVVAYMAGKAVRGEELDAQEKTLWQKIVSAIRVFLDRIGVIKYYDDRRIAELIRASYWNLKRGTPADASPNRKFMQLYQSHPLFSTSRKTPLWYSPLIEVMSGPKIPQFATPKEWIKIIENRISVPYTDLSDKKQKSIGTGEIRNEEIKWTEVFTWLANIRTLGDLGPFPLKEADKLVEKENLQLLMDFSYSAPISYPDDHDYYREKEIIFRHGGHLEEYAAPYEIQKEFARVREILREKVRLLPVKLVPKQSVIKYLETNSEKIRVFDAEPDKDVDVEISIDWENPESMYNVDDLYNSVKEQLTDEQIKDWVKRFVDKNTEFDRKWNKEIAEELGREAFKVDDDVWESIINDLVIPSFNDFASYEDVLKVVGDMIDVEDRVITELVEDLAENIQYYKYSGKASYLDQEFDIEVFYEDLEYSISVDGNHIGTARRKTEVEENIKEHISNEVGGSPKYFEFTLDLPGASIKNYQTKLLLWLNPPQGVSFESSHWEEQNHLAHIRAYNTETKDGKTYLVIDEIQSDWHQEVESSLSATENVELALKNMADEVVLELERYHEKSAQNISAIVNSLISEDELVYFLSLLKRAAKEVAAGTPTNAYSTERQSELIIGLFNNFRNDNEIDSIKSSEDFRRWLLKKDDQYNKTLKQEFSRNRPQDFLSQYTRASRMPPSVVLYRARRRFVSGIESYKHTPFLGFLDALLAGHWYPTKAFFKGIEKNGFAGDSYVDSMKKKVDVLSTFYLKDNEKIIKLVGLMNELIEEMTRESIIDPISTPKTKKLLESAQSFAIELSKDESILKGTSSSSSGFVVPIEFNTRINSLELFFEEKSNSMKKVLDAKDVFIPPLRRTWQIAAFQWGLRHAAENDLDGVVILPGEVHSARWRSSDIARKHVGVRTLEAESFLGFFGKELNIGYDDNRRIVTISRNVYTKDKDVRDREHRKELFIIDTEESVQSVIKRALSNSGMGGMETQKDPFVLVSVGSYSENNKGLYLVTVKSKIPDWIGNAAGLEVIEHINKNEPQIEIDGSRNWDIDLESQVFFVDDASEFDGKSHSVDSIISHRGLLVAYNKIMPHRINDYLKKLKTKLSPILLEYQSNIGINYSVVPVRGRKDSELYVYGVEMTPELKEKVLQPMPLLFSRKWMQRASKTRNAVMRGTNDFDLPDPSSASRAWNWLVYKVQDKFVDLFKTQREALEWHGATALPEKMDAYLQQTLFHGRVEHKIEEFEKEYVEPLIKMIKESGYLWEDVEDFLYARHAPEANAHLLKINDGDPKYNSGMSDNDAARVIARLSDEGDITKLQEIGLHVDRMTKWTRDQMVMNGLEDADTVAAWEATYKHYVPLKGWKDVADDPDLQGFFSMPKRGRGVDTGGTLTKRRTGRTSLAANILANVVAQAQATIILSEKAKVGRALYEFVSSTPSSRLWSVDEVEYTRFVDKNTGLVRRGINPSYKLADNVIRVKKDGKDYHITFNPAVPEMARLAMAMKNLSADQIGPILGFLHKVNRYLSAVNTALSPEFTITNALRDVQTALLNLNEQQIESIKRKIIADWGKAWYGIRKSQRGKQSEWVDEWEAFKRAGAKVGWIDHYKSPVDLEKKLRQMMGPDGVISWTADGIRAVGRFIENENLAVENAIRLATFKNLKDAGVSEQRAAEYAKNLTVNFNRKGEAGTVLNSLYLFANASVQGTARLFAALRNPKVRNVALGVMFVGIMLDIVNRAVGDEDDDKERLYDKISAYDKERNIIIMLPPEQHVTLSSGQKLSYLKIPLPYGFNVIYNTGTTFGKLIDHLFIGNVRRYNPAEEAALLVGSAVGAFSFIGDYASLSQFLLPTLADPFVQIAENRAFHGGKLMPDDYPGQPPSPDSQKFYRSVPLAYKNAADWLNRQTGGTEVTPGFIDISPETMQHWANFATGGLGRFIESAINVPAKSLLAPEELEAREIAFIRRVVGGIGDRETQETFYSHLTEIDRAKKEIDAVYELGVQTEEGQRRLQYVAKRYPVASLLIRDVYPSFGRGKTDEELGRHKTLKQLRESIAVPRPPNAEPMPVRGGPRRSLTAELRDARREIRRLEARPDMPAKERRERINAEREKIRKIMLDFNRRWNEVEDSVYGERNSRNLVEKLGPLLSSGSRREGVTALKQSGYESTAELIASLPPLPDKYAKEFFFVEASKELH